MRAVLGVLALARLRRDHASQAPQPKDWPLGPYHWPAHYTQFVPSNVADICGGSVGHTQWGDVNADCAQYAIRLSQCVQVCSGSNSMGGFGDCLAKCGVGPPDCAHCDGSADPSMSTYCHEFCARSQTCKCVEPAHTATALDFTTCVDECVYPCSTALETELLLGVSLPWRHAKCGSAVFFACGGDDGLQCEKVNPVECEGPVGLGTKICYGDDPWCSDKHWICATPTNETVPLPAQVVRATSEEQWAALYYPPLWNASNATEVSMAWDLRGVPPPKASKLIDASPALLARALSGRLRKARAGSARGLLARNRTATSAALA